MLVATSVLTRTIIRVFLPKEYGDAANPLIKHGVNLLISQLRKVVLKKIIISNAYKKRDTTNSVYNQIFLAT